MSMLRCLCCDVYAEVTLYIGERMYAHGGIVAAAASILQDMARHDLLHQLLEEFDPYGLASPQPQDG